MQLLDGSFIYVWASTNPIPNCQKATYYKDANNNTFARIERPNCCLQSDNYDYTPTKLTFDLGPVPGYITNCPEATKSKGATKLLGTTGSGNTLCLISAVCNGDFYGITVSCKGKAPLLLELIFVLSNLLGVIGIDLALALQPVPQTCVFPINNCPVN